MSDESSQQSRFSKEDLREIAIYILNLRPKEDLKTGRIVLFEPNGESFVLQEGENANPRLIS